MTRKPSKRLVIDASVARAAGETEHPVSSSCRRFLQDVRDICHRAVVTPTIDEEWERHQSRFFRKWCRSMTAKKKLEKITPNPLNLDLDCFGQEERNAIEKDLCLLEAAIAADKMLVTLDDSLRAALESTPQGRRFLKQLHWCNPPRDGSGCLHRGG